MNIQEECRKAAAIAARVLELKTPFRLVFDEAEEKIRIGREVLIHIDLENIPPLNLYSDLGITASEEWMGAIFETYRQVRFLYQRTVLESYYVNAMVGWNVVKQPESDQTCLMFFVFLEITRQMLHTSWIYL